jgi:hypothetical protein
VLVGQEEQVVMVMAQVEELPVLVHALGLLEVVAELHRVTGVEVTVVDH